MATWNNSVITNAGLELLEQSLSGDGIVISRAALGGGTVDVSALVDQTVLTDPLVGTTVVISSQKPLSGSSGREIKLQIRNTGLSAAATFKQVGIFAACGGVEVLFAISQDESGEEIPSAAEYPDFMEEFTAAVTISQTYGVTVEVSSLAFVTKAELEESLSGKSDSGHKHTTSDISDLPKLGTAAQKNAGDFVDAADKNAQALIPAGSDIPAWLWANAKKYTRYYSKYASSNSYVNAPPHMQSGSEHIAYYWFDGMNVTAIGECGMMYVGMLISGVFSGWSPARSGKNELDNPDFRINQRGQAEYTSGYTVDRWYSPGKCSAAPISGGVKLTSTVTASSTTHAFWQDFEFPLPPGKYTLSLKAADVTGVWAARIRTVTAAGDYVDSYYTPRLQAGINSVTVDLSDSEYISAVSIGCNKGTEAGNSLKLAWVKLELGSAATPFVPPDPATELLKCQRYFTIYKHQNATSNTDKCSIGVGYALTGSIVYAVLPIAAMRSGVAATVSYSGLSLINGTDTVVDFSSATALEQTDSTVQVAFTVSGQTPGTVYRLHLMNSDAYLVVSKEL